MSREFWGTFSVADHKRRRPFVTDVLLYDHLAIPVPDGRDEWRRWTRKGRDPDRQARLIEILGDHAIPIFWTMERHEQWALDYAEASEAEIERARGGSARVKVATAIEGDMGYLHEARQAGEDDPDSLAQAVTRTVVATGAESEANRDQIAGLPRVEVDAVPAYGSLSHLRREQPYDISTTSPPSSGRPVLMFEFPVLVPSSSEPDEALLRKAVRLAGLDETREYRAAFHSWRRDMIRSGVAEEAAYERLAALGEEYRKASRAVKFKTRARYGVGVFGALAGVAALVFPPAGFVAAFAALGSVVADSDEPQLTERLEVGAFYHQARRALA